MLFEDILSDLVAWMLILELHLLEKQVKYFKGKDSLLENFLVGSALSIETTFSVPPGTDYGRQESL